MLKFQLLKVDLLHSFKYVNITCVTFMHEHICLNSFTRHMCEFWFENGVNGFIFISKFLDLSRFETITHIMPERWGQWDYYLQWFTGSNPMNHLLFFLLSCGYQNFNLNRSNFY